MHFSVNLSKEKLLGCQLCKYLVSPILIRFLQGKAHLKGYDPNYFHVKSLAYLKGNEAAATVIILLPPKQL